MPEEVCVIFSGVKGYLDKIAVKDVTEFEAALLTALRSSGAKILSDIEEKQKLDEALEAKMHEFIGNFADNFANSKKKAA